jgi:hypothetical protein
MGLVEIENLSVFEDIHGTWMEADYSITTKGVQAAQRIRETPIGKSTGLYLDELVFAFARLNSRTLDRVALLELNYAAPGVAEGALISFDNAESNLALRKVTDFEQAAPEALTNRMREQLQLYLRYIDREDAA